MRFAAHRTTRGVIAGSAMLAALAIGGCASSVAGTAAFVAASSSSRGGTGTPSSGPSGSSGPSLPIPESSDPPSSSAPPSSSPPPASSAPPPATSVSGGVADNICKLVTPAQLTAIFGGLPTYKNTLDNNCQYTHAGVFVIVAEFSTFTVTSQTQETGSVSDFSIGDHPGAVLKDGNVVLSEGSTATTEGVVKAYCGTAEEQGVAKKLLAIVIRHYAHT